MIPQIGITASSFEKNNTNLKKSKVSKGSGPLIEIRISFSLWSCGKKLLIQLDV